MSREEYSAIKPLSTSFSNHIYWPIYSQPHQRAAQGDCPHPPWQREEQPDPHWGGSPGCAGSQEGAAWACVTHGKYKPEFTGKMLQTGSWCAITEYTRTLYQENERTKDLIIEQRFHRAIIGQKGEKIKEVRDKFPEVCWRLFVLACIWCLFVCTEPIKFTLLVSGHHQLPWPSAEKWHRST